MARTILGMDPRLAGLPVMTDWTVGLDIGRTFAKRTGADANGRRHGAPVQVRTSDFVHAGATELVIHLLQGQTWLPKLGGITVAGKEGENGTIVPTNIADLGVIDPDAIYSRTGVRFTSCNDVVAFLLGTTSTSDIEVFKPGYGPVSRKRPTRSGLFLTSGTNSARARYIPKDDIWDPIAAETGWVGLQPEHGNLMELYFMERMGLTEGEVGAELMVSLGTGILNWHAVLRDAPDKVLDFYLDNICTARLRPPVLRPHPMFLEELELVGDEDAGRVFDKWAMADDPYAGMVMSALCAAQGAYCRIVALMDVPDTSEGLFINSPMFVNPDMRKWILTRTRFLARFIGRNTVGNGSRFVEYLERLPIIIVTDRYVVPHGAAVNVGVERVLNGDD